MTESFFYTFLQPFCTPLDILECLFNTAPCLGHEHLRRFTHMPTTEPLTGPVNAHLLKTCCSTRLLHNIPGGLQNFHLKECVPGTVKDVARTLPNGMFLPHISTPTKNLQQQLDHWVPRGTKGGKNLYLQVNMLI